MMAINKKCIFIVTIVCQITVLVVYLALRNQLETSVIAMSIVNFPTFQQKLSQNGSNLTDQVIAPYPRVVVLNAIKNIQQMRPATRIVNRATIVEDAGRNHNESVLTTGGSNFTGKLDLQKRLCGDATSEGLLPTNDLRKFKGFQPIDDKQAWLYSAFFDHVAAQNGRPLVRVYGVAKNVWLQKVYCNFSMDGRNLTAMGVVIALPDSHGRASSPTHLECPLPNNYRPTHVSVSFGTTDKPTNRLKILYPGPRIRNFTVCYSVLHSGYNKKTQLIESIELNRILGAEHFMVYNYSISPEVSQILIRYQEDGLVTVLQWPLPTLDSWYFAQMTALNDCFYRNRNTSRFVVVVDTDELIVPRYHYTWMELIHNVSPQETDVSNFFNKVNPSTSGHNPTGCFMMRSSYFTTEMAPTWDSLPSQLQLGEDEKKNIIKYKITSLSQLTRKENIFPHKVKSKYIARPELVYIPGIHVVHKFIYYMRCLNVDENAAIVHHYRISTSNKGIVKDSSIIKFKETLYPRVMEMIQRFPKIFT